MKKIGLLGGTFDPIHKGHIELARRARERLGLDEVILVPGGNMPHKDTAELGSRIHRLNMVRIAAEGIDGISVSDYEIQKETTCYTVETLLHFHEIYPNSEFYFISGSDILFDLPGWKDPEGILSRCELAVFTRSYDYQRILNQAEKLRSDYGASIYLFLENIMPVSSTEVREALNKKESCEDVLDRRVLSYIRENSLYGTGAQAPQQHNVLPVIEMQAILQRELTGKRYAHSVAVSEEAVQLARRYGADEEKARVAGLLHDCAKPLPSAELFRLCKKHGIVLDEQLRLQPQILHGFVGAALLEEKFGIRDPEIYDAVYYHTTGKPDMPLLTKIIFLADYIEPNRRQTAELAKIRTLAFEDIDQAVTAGLCYTISYLLRSGSLIHELSFRARNYYITQEKRMLSE